MHITEFINYNKQKWCTTLINTTVTTTNKNSNRKQE